MHAVHTELPVFMIDNSYDLFIAKKKKYELERNILNMSFWSILYLVFYIEIAFVNWILGKKSFFAKKLST